MRSNSTLAFEHSEGCQGLGGVDVEEQYGDLHVPSFFLLDREESAHCQASLEALGYSRRSFVSQIFAKLLYIESVPSTKNLALDNIPMLSKFIP